MMRTDTGRKGPKNETFGERHLVRTPVSLPDGSPVPFPAKHKPSLAKAVIEQFCFAFVPGGIVLHIGDMKNKIAHLETAGLAALGVTLNAAAKIPDVIVHDIRRNWLFLIEVVTNAGPIDSKRRRELKELFTGSSAHLIFVTAFNTRKAMQPFVAQIAWGSEVWIADDPSHMIHFNGNRLPGPYPDAMPKPPP